MMRSGIKYFSISVVILFSLQSFAEDTIKITVSTTEKTAAAIGFTVDGKESGCLGQSYSGEGPKNTQYQFGYKKDNSAGSRISCGSLTLSEHSNVTLTMADGKCQSAVSQ